MSTDHLNPYQPPRTASESQAKADARKPHFLLFVFAIVGVVIYVLLSLALVFGDSVSDTLMGGLLLCSTPAMCLWLWANWSGDAKATLFGWGAVAMQVVVGCLMLVLLRRVPKDQVFTINGTAAVAIASLAMLFRRTSTP